MKIQSALALVLCSMCSASVPFLQHSTQSSTAACLAQMTACEQSDMCTLCLSDYYKPDLDHQAFTNCDNLINTWYQGFNQECEIRSLELSNLLICGANYVMDLVWHGLTPPRWCGVDAVESTTTSAPTMAPTGQAGRYF
jgi:hypothetical protein